MRSISVTVKPKAKKPAVVPQPDGSLVVAVTAAPQKGKANAAVIKAIAAHLHLSPAQLIIKRGETAKHKTVMVLNKAVTR